MPKHFPKTHRYHAFTPSCRLYEFNACIGRMRLEGWDGEEGLDD